MSEMPEKPPIEPEHLAHPVEDCTVGPFDPTQSPNGHGGSAAQEPAEDPAEQPAASTETAFPQLEQQTPPQDIAHIEPPTQEPPTPTLFQQYQYDQLLEQERIPHLGHIGILCVLSLAGLFGASVVARSALEFHLFGVTTLKQAVTDVHYTLGTEAVFYLFTFFCCLLVFPFVWRKGFLTGIHWRGTTALKLRGQLFGAASLCFLLAIVNGVLMPGPSNAPIDIIFRSPGAAWLLFGFGITLAPLFEEMGFRGFLLPALCTAIDWIHEKSTDTLPRPLDVNGHPQWSLPAMVIASLLTSVPFALMHAEQTSYALGPFILLVFVSLVLCWARLHTRSLAASVLVHMSYNFLLFSLMLFGTGGFRHLDKM